MIAKFFRDVPIYVKTTAGFATILAVLGAMGVLVMLQMSDLADEQDRATMAGDASDIAAALRTDIETMRGAVRGYLLTGADNQRFRAEQAFSKYKADGGRLDRLLSRTQADLRPMVVGDINLINRSIAPGLSAELRLGSRRATRSHAIALVAAPASEHNRTIIDRSLDQIGDGLLQWSLRLADSARASMHKTLIVIIVGGGLAAAVIVLMAVYVVKSICRPLRDMTRSLRGLAEGDLETDPPQDRRGDEIGDIARAIELFQEAAVEKRRLESEADGIRAHTEEGRRRDDESRAVRSAEQALILDKVGSALTRLAEGDLATRIGDDFPTVYEPLRQGFNASAAQLCEAIAEVAQSSHVLQDGCDRLLADARELAERSDRQATRLEGGAVALTGITATVRQTAKVADAARLIASRAKNDTIRSNVIIGRANSTMRAIEDFTQRIGVIADTINEISRQTNLLAFNASVEAARLGDRQSGFGVIAVEIRSLANRAVESAIQINAIIGDSDGLIRSSMSIVGDVSDTLDLIATHVSDLDQQSERIAIMAGEQADGLTSVNATIDEVDALARENRGIADRTATATTELTRHGRRLLDLVERFRLEPQ